MGRGVWGGVWGEVWGGGYGGRVWGGGGGLWGNVYGKGGGGGMVGGMTFWSATLPKLYQNTSQFRRRELEMEGVTKLAPKSKLRPGRKLPKKSKSKQKRVHLKTSENEKVNIS